MSKDGGKQMEVLAQLGKLALSREEFIRQIQNLDQEANQLKLRLLLLDSNKDKSNGE
ncbi:MAG: hypothetical protein ACYSX1_10650 [Planctomycetota bacterium]|jgi:hypothetical protein